MTATEAGERRVAVLLNRNARGVTDSLIATVESLGAAEDIFVTSSVADARSALERVVEGRHDVLIVGGGDGTFVHVLQALASLRPTPKPILFALRLGSGNAIADVCGASRTTRRGLAADLARARSREAPVRLRLLCADERPSYSLGIGIDARFSADLDAFLKPFLGRGRLATWLRGFPGMVATGLLHTLPELFRRPPFRLRIINLGASAARLGRDGRPTSRSMCPGDILFDGEATIAAASTVETYGRGLHFFPYTTQHPGYFQLRVARVRSLATLAHFPSIFAGTWHDDRHLWDWRVTAVRLEIDPAEPVHVGGELLGARSTIEVSLSPQSFPILGAPPVAGRTLY